MIAAGNFGQKIAHFGFGIIARVVGLMTVDGKEMLVAYPYGRGVLYRRLFKEMTEIAPFASR